MWVDVSVRGNEGVTLSGRVYAHPSITATQPADRDYTTYVYCRSMVGPYLEEEPPARGASEEAEGADEGAHVP